VVKVRGNAGECRSWPYKLQGSIPRPCVYTAINGTNRLRKAPSVYNRGAQVFSEFLGPQIYTLTTTNKGSIVDYNMRPPD